MLTCFCPCSTASLDGVGPSSKVSANGHTSAGRLSYYFIFVMGGSAASSYVPRQSLCTGEIIVNFLCREFIQKLYNSCLNYFSITKFIPECVHYLLEEKVPNLWQEVGLPAQAPI